MVLEWRSSGGGGHVAVTVEWRWWSSGGDGRVAVAVDWWWQW
jgi:hypothetical protein